MVSLNVKKNYAKLVWKSEVLKGLADEYMARSGKSDIQSSMFVGQGLSRSLRDIAKELVELAKKIPQDAYQDDLNGGKNDSK